MNTKDKDFLELKREAQEVKLEFNNLVNSLKAPQKEEIRLRLFNNLK